MKEEREELRAAKQKKARDMKWGWLRIESRKLLIEIIQEVDRKGRREKGERKKRELLEKLGERKRAEGWRIAEGAMETIMNSVERKLRLRKERKIKDFYWRN